MLILMLFLILSINMVYQLAAFMEVVEGVFVDGVEEVGVLCMWVRLLLKKNIGHIINNP